MQADLRSTCMALMLIRLSPIGKRKKSGSVPLFAL